MLTALHVWKLAMNGCMGVMVGRGLKRDVLDEVFERVFTGDRSKVQLPSEVTVNHAELCCDHAANWFRHAYIAVP